MAESFILNIGPNGTYDKATGRYYNFSNGIWEFRVGDEVENVHNGRRHTIAELYPRANETMGTPCYVKMTNGSGCCVLVLRPVNQQRITFGYILCTLMQHPEYGPIGSCIRFITRTEVDAEVERLRSIGYPGSVEILDAPDGAVLAK